MTNTVDVTPLGTAADAWAVGDDEHEGILAARVDDERSKDLKHGGRLDP
jgi:hypothetical protein